MSDKVVIYGTDTWPYTQNARSAYKDGAQYFDVKKDGSKLEEMLKHSGGKREVPVILKGDNVTIGFGGTWGI